MCNNEFCTILNDLESNGLYSVLQSPKGRRKINLSKNEFKNCEEKYFKIKAFLC